jgi:hypothetical protein
MSPIQKGMGVVLLRTVNGIPLLKMLAGYLKVA